jgi:hypothetical protein
MQFSAIDSGIAQRAPAILNSSARPTSHEGEFPAAAEALASIVV